MNHLLRGLLLGFLLAVRRVIDHGSLWGCVGLHGGLVGGWFVVSSGLIEFSLSIPEWLFGFGNAANSNPISGLLAIVLLTIILLTQLRTLAIAR